tara:strand:+ start:418 stop:1263 length:846 start_codon:yes stop_codon:yes gene_type:complete
MPLKNTNKQLITDFIKHKKDEKKVSKQTLNTYKNVGDNISFNILTTQKTIIKKLKELYTNPNTIQLYLNLIILVRRHNDKETNQLIAFRNTLKEKIINERKGNMKEMNDTLPTYETIKDKLNNMNGIMYIINYLIFNIGLRNKDINLKFVNTLPDKLEENYIQLKNNKVILTITDYKTDKKYGTKKINIDDTRFINELKDLNLVNEEYIISKKDNSKINNISTWNEKLIKLSIDKLGQKLVKINIKKLLDESNFKEIETVGKNRGTSLSVLLTSYNLMHNK